MSGYTRNYGAPQAGRDPTFPRFHIESVRDEIASAAAGRPIFKDEERVQLIVPGSPNAPVERVTDAHRERWPDQYAAFKRGQEFTTDGTPLEQWSILSRAQVLEMKALGIHSIEQCAGLADTAVQKIGMGGSRIRELARAYLDDAEAQKVTSDALARAERAEAQLSALQKQIDEMRPMMDSMHAELMTLKNAHHPVATVIPGMMDPMQGMAPAPGPVAGSSLDALALPKRGPGRPPKSVAA